MREILFRGAQKVDGSKSLYWYEGSLVREKDVYTGEVEYYIENENGSFLVIPETVGQYIVFTDKNGKKIFEEDIVKYKNTDGIKVNGVALTVIGKINYNEKTASFAIDGKDKIGAKHYDYFPIKNIEVIGNIHDNPELLKELNDKCQL